MNLINQFINLIQDQVNKGIYVWGGDGHNLSEMTDPKAWIKKHETSAKNADRAIALYQKRVNKGIDPILAFDCSGLIYWALKKLGIQKGDLSSRGFYGICTPIAKSEIRKGDLLFHWSDKDGDKAFDVSEIHHVGAALSKTEVIECQGRDVGVVKNKYRDSSWNAYGRPKAFAKLDPNEEEPPANEPELPSQPDDPSEYWRDIYVTTPYMRGPDVMFVQTALVALGYDVGKSGCDGIYGKDTAAAVKEFQADELLPVTGRMDFATWSALLETISQSTAAQYYGDADGDGKLTSADAAKILRSIVHIEGALTLQQGDADCNGRVDSADAAHVLRCVVGLDKPNKI